MNTSNIKKRRDFSFGYTSDGVMYFDETFLIRGKDYGHKARLLIKEYTNKELCNIGLGLIDLGTKLISKGKQT